MHSRALSRLVAFLVAAVLGVGREASSQENAASAAAELPWKAEVAALFARWDRRGSPGCALGVIQEGKLVLARGFGEASLEHAVPITPQTVFDIGSTSKQFTAACVGLLEQENELGLEDDLRDWIPELQDFGRTITVAHLLHHTSGLPDYLGLFAAEGIHHADWTTPADALACLARVATLRFPPGEQHEYSNSNYFLLSLVVERAAEQDLARFARERFFEPLGMTQTLFLDDHTLVIPHRATGYAPRTSGGFQVDMSDFEQLGDGAVQTTIEDLAKWDANFYSRKVGGERLQHFLHATGRLNDGTELEYAAGLSIDVFRGLRRVSHGGAWAGYRAQLMRFPDEKTAIACLCNLASMDPTALCERVAEIVLRERLTAEEH